MSRSQQTLTLRQIAELARTSKSTVSRVLTNHPNVSENTRRRVLDVIAKHHFRPNLFARGLAGGKTGLIGVIATEINSGFFAEVLRGVDVVVGQQEGHVLSSFAHGPEDFQRLWQDMAQGRKVDGIILVAPTLPVLNRAIEDAEPPVVLCACRPQRSDGPWCWVDSVVVDNHAAFTTLLHHVYDNGRRRILFLAGPEDVWDSIERREAVESFARERSDLHLEIVSGAMTREEGRRLIAPFVGGARPLPEAVIATNDRLALGAMEVLGQHGVRIPEDVAVTGCDDEDAAALVGLTTLHMPMMNLGRESAHLLFERMARHGDQLPGVIRVLPMTLQVRKSTSGTAPKTQNL